MEYEFSKKDTVNKKSAYLLGAMLGVLSTLVAMLGFSAVILFFNVDRAYAAPFATISLALGSFVASNIAAKRIGDKGYIVGLIIGLTVFMLITVLSLIMGGSISLNTLFHFIIVTLSSLVGGITGVNGQSQKKYI